MNSSRAIKAELVWEIAGRHAKKSVAGGVPMSYPTGGLRGSILGTFSARRMRPALPATRDLRGVGEGGWDPIAPGRRPVPRRWE